MTEKRRRLRRWTKSEDASLREAIAKYDGTTIDWREVATHLEGRTNKDCRKRWVYALRIVVTKGPWGPDEDQRLEAGVELHGCRWNKVSEVVGTRQADQCSRRWHECLNPKINRSRWSVLEDSTLEYAVRVYGRNWTEIVERFFCDRTPIAARNRYRQRFEKGSGLSSSSISQNQDHEVPITEEEALSPSSSIAEGNGDNNPPLPLSWPEPPDISAYGHLPTLHIPPVNLSTDGNLPPSSGGSASVGSRFSLLEPFSACPSSTDIPNSGIHPGAAAAAAANTTGPLSHIALPDTEAAFCELCAPSSFGGFGADNVTSGPKRHYHGVNSSTPRLINAASTPPPPSSSFSSSSSTATTAAPLPDWYQLSGSLSLDQIISQVASYRVHAAGFQGGEYPDTLDQEGFVAEQRSGVGVLW